MKITTRGNIAAFVGFYGGLIVSFINGAAVWQTMVAGTAFAIAFLIITPRSIE